MCAEAETQQRIFRRERERRLPQRQKDGSEKIRRENLEKAPKNSGG
jgi:hypothetical protein